MAQLKAELIDELNDMLDTLSPIEAYVMFKKLSQPELMALIVAIQEYTKGAPYEHIHV